MPAIIVHGGAGTVNLTSDHERGVADAVRAGWSALDGGKRAVDAVEAAVVSMEDNPLFNAGYGSSLNAAGYVEADASIMLDDLSFGAVAALTAAANPIRAARLVMERTDHLMLAGSGADEFARKVGLKGRDLRTAARRELYAKRMATLASGGELKYLPKLPGLLDDLDLGTVGACAIDADGRIAAATSTGGLMMKLPGRVGDSAIIGAGTYAVADGGVSATGHGEAITRFMLAKEAVGAMAELGAQKAIDRILDTAAARGVLFGLVGISRAGAVAHGFTTQAMSWASIEDAVLSTFASPG